MITVLARQQSWQRQKSFGRGSVAGLPGTAESEEAPSTPVKADSPALEAMKHVVSFVKTGDSVPIQVRARHNTHVRSIGVLISLVFDVSDD